MAKMLESQEAARRLGVKVATLYAYVSRGLLPSYPAPDGRRSLFAVEDVERLAHRAHGGKQVESRLASITTAVTQLRPDGPAYRGVPARALAGTATFEATAALLWQVPEGPWEPLALPRPPALDALALLRWTTVLVGAAEPPLPEGGVEATAASARRLIATAVAPRPPRAAKGGPTPGGAHGPSGSIASQVAARCTAARGGARAGPTASPTAATRPARGQLATSEDPTGNPAVVRAIDAALVLLADHELATSTLAVRVAASTRASLHDSVLAGLGAMAGRLHGGASPLAHRLLVDAEAQGAGPAVDEALRWQGRLPGFGHAVYRDGDPRAPALLAPVRELASPARWETVQAVVARADQLGIPGGNVDLALGALAFVCDWPPWTGPFIFTVARMAGWTAHYLEELAERPVRFRARAVYVVREPAMVPPAGGGQPDEVGITTADGRPPT